MNKFSSELLSTFFLVFAGTGSIIINEESNGSVTLIGIALTFGIAVTLMILIFGKYSGAHMNPAVTLALSSGNMFSRKEILPYIGAQFIGAMIASLLLKKLFPGNALLGGTFPAGSEIQSFLLEFSLTFFLMLTVLFTTQKENIYAPFVIGCVILLEALLAGPICGASMNPFRSLAPALITGNMKSLWIYLTAPLLGAITATFIFKALKRTGL